MVEVNCSNVGDNQVSEDLIEISRGKSLYEVH